MILLGWGCISLPIFLFLFFFSSETNKVLIQFLLFLCIINTFCFLLKIREKLSSSGNIIGVVSTVVVFTLVKYY